MVNHMGKGNRGSGANVDVPSHSRETCRGKPCAKVPHSSCVPCPRWAHLAYAWLVTTTNMGAFKTKGFCSSGFPAKAPLVELLPLRGGSRFAMNAPVHRCDKDLCKVFQGSTFSSLCGGIVREILPQLCHNTVKAL